MSQNQITFAGRTVTLVEMPAAPGLSHIEWDYQDQVASVRSVFTGQTQRQKWPGADLLAGTAELPPLTAAQADDWEAFLMQLRGIANVFQMGDPLRSTPRGSGGAFGNHPQADNTVAGGNAAGSETLGTKGWIPSTLVLKRGDWVQLEYRLYRVLDDVWSDSSGKALLPIWPSLREQPSQDGTSSGYVNATGHATMFKSRPLGLWYWGVMWQDFFVPTLPADAVIQGIYPVIVASATHDQANSYYHYGASLTYENPVQGKPFTSPSDPSNTSFSSTEFYDLNTAGGGTGIGTSLSALQDQCIQVILNQSLFLDSLSDVIDVTAVGYAIYYTSASAVTDTQMPAPFTVPAGQGVAWSLPLSVTPVSPASGDTGTAQGTPAIDNGNIIVNGARGIFTLASNKRSSSSDFSRMTKTGFAFEEYR